MAVINFSGLASGIDSTALISAYLDQQRATRIKPLQSKIEGLEATSTAFDELDSLLATLKTNADKFRAVNGSGLAKTATSSSESRVTASASNAATNGSYALNVLTTAKNANFSFDDRYASSSAAINSSINDGASAANRTVSVQVGTGSDQETVNVELTSTTSLSDFVNQFNSSSSKAEASVVNVGTSGSPSYAVVINSTAQGTAQGQVSVSVGSEITAAGSGAFGSSTLSQATDATFTVSGISGVITRGSNSVSDVVTGVTFSLNATGASTVTIGDDPTTTVASVQELVDSYNAVVEFISENDLVTQDSDTQSNVFGPLSSTSLDENVLSSLRSALSGSAISGGTVNTLSELGITTERDGTLKFDSSKLSAAIASDPESVRSITLNLGEDLAGVDGRIAQFTRFNGLIDSSQQSFSSEIERYNNRIDEIEQYLARQQQMMTSQYARLESVIGRMTSQQTALSALTGGQ